MERTRIAVLMVMSLSVAAAAVAAGPCERLGGIGATSAIGPNQFAGTAELLIDGVSVSATVTVTLVDQWISTSGTIHATTAHVFEVTGDGNGTCDGGEDCFETVDRTILSPDPDTPGLFRANEQNNVVGGTGAYDGACGKLTSHGWIDLAALPPTADWKVKGRLCACD